MKTPVAARSDPFDGTIYRHANHALIELLFHLLVALNYYQILLPAHPPQYLLLCAATRDFFIQSVCRGWCDGGVMMSIIIISKIFLYFNIIGVFGGTHLLDFEIVAGSN